jgi:hypothetical protein
MSLFSKKNISAPVQDRRDPEGVHEGVAPEGAVA